MHFVVVKRTDDAWERLKALVLDSVSSDHTKRAYSAALDNFRAWYDQAGRPPLAKAVVNGYKASLEAKGLGSATINVRLSAIRKLATEATDNGLLAPEIAAGIARVKGASRHGVRCGNWLTLGQAQNLLDCVDAATVKGKRDRAILGLLLGCGLRRSEAVALNVEHLQQREGRWVILDLLGKHRRVRTVPVPAWVKASIDQWTAVAAIETGALFHPVDKAGRVSPDRVSDKAIWKLLRKYAPEAGLTSIAPHDMRRTCAKLCRAAGGELEQIQLLLGHASVQTTERYLGTRQNLTCAPNDRIHLSR